MMRVRELRYCLTSLSDAERKQIANALDLQEESLAAMEQKLTDPAYYQDCLQKMDRKTYRWFWSVFLKKGKIKKQALHQEKNLPLSKVEYQHLLDAACRRGWIYCLRNRHMERMYYVPWEIRVAWARSISVAQSLRPLDEERVIPVQSNPLKASQAFFHFLTSLSHEPWLLNRTGHLSKKDLKKMDVELDLDDVHASWPGWSGFLLETARLLGLVTETKKHVAVHQTRWKSWLSTPWPKSVGQLYDAVRHVLLKDHPELDGFCLILEQLPAGTWWGLEQFWRRLKTEVPLKMPFQFIKRLQEGFITPMACMGWLESGRTEKGETCFRWMSYPPREWVDPGEMPVYVDPAPEVYVPFHFPWEKRHELSLWADFMGGDYMLVYEINERSLVRGLQYGRTVDKILEKLEAWAGEVPSSVTERLLDLKKRIGAVTLSTWTCLKIENDDGAKDWPVRLEEAGWEVKKLNGSEYFIKETPGKVRAWLKQQNREAIMEKKEWSGKAENLETDFEGIRDCRVEVPKPEPVPLPKAWFSGLRPYGINMAREMVRQSISHGLPLFMEHQGRKMEVYPEHLRYENGKWMMEALVGTERKNIHLGEVEAFQMLPSPSVSRENPLQ
ncbi:MULTISPECIES: helicase-associated domain-containing protein [unclassified Thermoactinomyces]|uniref:helicase-associated domain-containing protein n=1 Tax=unclassified Thermoactinomyces TaxID=2634588 RepID=UPI0018DC01CC|nr:MULTISPECIES: helicase-associated domain-containing protein [unclassified Thermoactinomyces]MBH8585922.1 helicase-associated domain-containing protein [Thermoactinomyces sp. CICC 10520]MBI0391356.1 helicase-associated domain-containing protein [Thermoactinomyces sp. CICC 24226]